MAEARTVRQELGRLEEIVRRLESQDLDLDESLRLFEEGVERLRAVRDRLAGAEAKVNQLLGDEPA
jgi:exodeoxyribonuclease VII small subunit